MVLPRFSPPRPSHRHPEEKGKTAESGSCPLITFIRALRLRRAPLVRKVPLKKLRECFELINGPIEGPGRDFSFCRVHFPPGSRAPPTGPIRCVGLWPALRVEQWASARLGASSRETRRRPIRDRVKVMLTTAWPTSGVSRSASGERCVRAAGSVARGKVASARRLARARGGRSESLAHSLARPPVAETHWH